MITMLSYLQSPARSQRKPTTDFATELPHVTASLVERQSANDSTLMGDQATNEELSAIEEKAESSTHVEGASAIESPPHVEGSQAINEEKSTNEEEQDTTDFSNDEGPQDLSSCVDSFLLSPMPLLEFSKHMNALVETGIKMTPRAKRQAPQPPPSSTTQTQKSVTWVIAPPTHPFSPPSEEHYRLRADRLGNIF